MPKKDAMILLFYIQQTHRVKKKHSPIIFLSHSYRIPVHGLMQLRDFVIQSIRNIAATLQLRCRLFPSIRIDALNSIQLDIIAAGIWEED